MSKNKYLIDKKVILDCERMTLSRDRESLKFLNLNAICSLLFIRDSLKKMI